MILQALYQLAQREKLMASPDFEPKPVAWIIRIDPHGKFLGFEGTHYTPPATGKKKPKSVPRRFLVPREGGRTSGDRAFFLYDKAEYALGIDPNGDSSKEKLATRFALFRGRVKDCLTRTGDQGIEALHQFLEQLANGEQSVTLPEGCVSNDLFAFVYAPDKDVLITEREKVRDEWRRQRSAVADDSGNNPVCLVSGERSSPAKLVPGIKRVPGGSTSGVALISFNTNAFESYGWDGNENAPISRDAAEACSTALNRLLDPAYPDPKQPGQALPKRNLLLSSDTVVCYWSAEKDDAGFSSAFGGLFSANEEEVGELYRSIWRGRPPEMDDPSAFYALTLTGTQGRAVVRDWFASTVSEVARNLARHFQDFLIVRNAPPPKGQSLPPHIPLGMVVESLADPTRSRKDGVPAPLAAALVHSAYGGLPYPLAGLQRAIQRYRMELGNEYDESGGWMTKHWNDARAAIIKAVLTRNYRMEVLPDMDPNNLNHGYVLGKLMAVLERIQSEALGNPNASVIDRFFSGASACPKAVFVRLLKSARHHVRKVQDDKGKGGFVFLLDRLVDELANCFDPKHNGFPSSLTLEQQGLFVLGYHQMRKWLWMKRDEREEWEASHADSPRAYLWSKEKPEVVDAAIAE